MDGSFVPQTSFHDAAAVGEINTLVHYELDLMVNDPADCPIVGDPHKTVRAIVHAEIPQDAPHL